MTTVWTVICETKNGELYNYGVYESLQEAIGVVIFENRKNEYDHNRHFEILDDAEAEGDYVLNLVEDETNKLIETYLFMSSDLHTKGMLVNEN